MKKVILFFALLYSLQTQAQITNITGPAGSGQFGNSVTVLTNGNYVVTDPSYDEGSLANIGAVYLYNGSTHLLVSTLKGSYAHDSIGSNSITVLPNGNFVVCSPMWKNKSGAVTWVNGSAGLSGSVNDLNSLVGRSPNDLVGQVNVLTNGSYVVSSPYWDNTPAIDAGAVTFCHYSSGRSGIVNSSNSLIGNRTNDKVGYSIITLTNGNYVVYSPFCSYGTLANAGAATWCSGITGQLGAVSYSNSLVGGNAEDGTFSYPPIALSNGNYVVINPFWDNGTIVNAGAVTWGNGTTGIKGIISVSNSLVGNTANDKVGVGLITPLSNGNCVINNSSWSNGYGAVTWCNGTAGIKGVVGAGNSLIGGRFSTALSNGNYVATNPDWNNASVTKAGAVTLCNGTVGTSGYVSITNSLVGSTANDQVGYGGIIALKNNGNFVILSPNWNNGTIAKVGAATWGNGTLGITGTINSSNSLVGNTTDDFLAPVYPGNKLVTALSNGNYVVGIPKWDNGTIIDAGAATWGNGTTGISGAVNSSNSLIGSTEYDKIGLVDDNTGYYGVTALNNGNYIVISPNWTNGTVTKAGAVTWGNGTTGISGTINSSNSLVGSTINDRVGFHNSQLFYDAIALNNGNYIVRSPYWDNGTGIDGGAVTWGDGTTGVTGTISTSNSLVGTMQNDRIGYPSMYTLSNDNYVVRSSGWHNGTASVAGAITWGNGTTGITGVVNSNNSLVGSTAGDQIGVGPYSSGITTTSNGNYIIPSQYWNNGTIADAGAISWGNGNNGVSGIITSCNSVLGTIASEGYSINYAYNISYDYLIVGRPAENIISIYSPVNLTLANTQDSISQNIYSQTATHLIANGGCRIIAMLTPGGTSPVSGSVNAKVWVETAVPVYGDDPFAARHYEITPANNASISEAKVTLYFTQQEFDDFNNHAGSILNLPVDAGDATGKANLRIGKYSGSSSNSSGLPGTYSGAPEIIDPSDADIIWNTGLNRWEVSFDVTGFSGFVVQTKTTALPLQLINFYAVPAQNNVLLNWKTTNEVNTKMFEVERSNNGSSFKYIGTIAAVNRTGDHSYIYTDTGVALLNTGNLYYRLKQIDNNGRYSYSPTVMLHLAENNSIAVYPNPVTNITTLSCRGKTLLNTQAVLLDIQGNRIMQFAIVNYETKIDMSHLPDGMYVLKLRDGTALKLIKN